MIFFRNGYLLWLSVLILLVAGLSALSSMPRLEDPRMANRNPIVVTPYPGADAELVEATVTKKLEEVLQEVPEIKELESTSRGGVSSISIELVDSVTSETNEEVFSKIRDRLADAALPDTAAEPIFDDLRGAVAYTLILGITWTDDATPRVGMLKRTAEDLADRLRGISGTEIVRLHGEPEEEILVTLDPDEASALGLSAAEIARATQQADAKQPAGTLRGPSTDFALEVAGELDSVDRIREIPLREGNAGTLIRLGEVANVERSWRTPPDAIATVDGQRAIFVAARMKPGERVDVWADAAMTIVEQFRTERDLHSGAVGGIEVATVFDQSQYTNERLGSLAGNLIAGAAVIVVVIFLLMGWRSAILVGSALPLVSGFTLFLLLMTGGSLHQMSIFGMIIALGLLIDNAIVVVDEIRKAREAGKNSAEAVRETLHHLFAPLLASTLTTVFAFAPIVLLPGNIGDFVGSIGGSVILAIIASFLVALTVTAALAGRYDRAATGDHHSFVKHGFRSRPLADLYHGGLRVMLKVPLTGIGIAVTPAVLGFVLFATLGNQFFPRVDRNMFHAQIWLPSDASLAQTNRTATEMERVLREHEAVKHVYWLQGGSAPSVYYNLLMNQDNVRNYAQAVIVTHRKEQAKPLIRELQAELDRRFVNAQTVVNQFAQGPPIDAPVQFRLSGPDVSVLQNLGEEVRRRLQAHPQVLHVQATMERGEPKIGVELDADESRLVGLRETEVASQLRANLDGMRGGSVLEEIVELPVRVRYDETIRGDLGRISQINLVSPTSVGDGSAPEWVPLPTLGQTVLKPETGGITRKDNIRCNIIKGFVTNEALPIDIARTIMSDLEADGFQVPSGYRFELGGDAEEEGDAVKALTTYLPVLMTLTVATLILVFRSIMLAGLLGVVGLLSVGLGLLSTWCFGFPFSFNTIMGTLGLIGVALNDNIVVLAAIRANPLARAGDIDAIVDEISGATRHVLATTLTTAGGFVPLILSGGDFWPPLAVVIAGGVIGATLLALLFVPCTYRVLTLLPFFGDRKAEAEEESPTLAAA